MGSRAFGIAATGNLSLAGEVAARAEQLGYSTIWTNDVPGADGLAVAAAMAASASSIRLGVGALACDRRTPREVAGAIEGLGLPQERLLVVVGSGLSPHPVEAAESAALELRDLTGASVGLAAMGPQMCRLAGRIGGMVLLNWMNPGRIRWARSRLAEGAGHPPGELPEVASYVRFGRDEAAVAAEAARYARQGHYRRALEAMGGTGGGVWAPEALAAYDEVLDETVVRALPWDGGLEGILSIAEAGAP